MRCDFFCIYDRTFFQVVRIHDRTFFCWQVHRWLHGRMIKQPSRAAVVENFDQVKTKTSNRP